MNERGHFCYKPPEEDRSKKTKEKLHISPQIAQILAASGKVAHLRVHEIPEEEGTSDF